MRLLSKQVHPSQRQRQPPQSNQRPASNGRGPNATLVKKLDTSQGRGSGRPRRVSGRWRSYDYPIWIKRRCRRYLRWRRSNYSPRIPRGRGLLLTCASSQKMRTNRSTAVARMKSLLSKGSRGRWRWSARTRVEGGHGPTHSRGRRIPASSPRCCGQVLLSRPSFPLQPQRAHPASSLCHAGCPQAAQEGRGATTTPGVALHPFAPSLRSWRLSTRRPMACCRVGVVSLRGPLMGISMSLAPPSALSPRARGRGGRPSSTA